MILFTIQCVEDDEIVLVKLDDSARKVMSATEKEVIIAGALESAMRKCVREHGHKARFEK